MTTGAVVFLVLSWTFVLGLTVWSFSRVLRSIRKQEPDETGPAPRG